MRDLPILFALVMTATFCRSTTAVGTASAARKEAGMAACRAAKAAAIEALQASHAACAVDSDCVPQSQVWLGCAGWASVTAPAPADLDRGLFEACMGLPLLAQSCDGNVGACVQGRCAGRASRGGDCDGAFAALLARAQQPTGCQADADCGSRWIEGAHRAVPARLEVVAAKEHHAVADACPAEAENERRRPTGPWKAPRCLEGTCGLVEPGQADQLTRPRLRDPHCVADRLGALLSSSGLRGGATLKFAVAADGRPGAFSFVGLVPVGLHDPLMAGVAQCAWDPGTRNGKPVTAWVTLPLKVK